jgi:hypothetical protein
MASKTFSRRPNNYRQQHPGEAVCIMAESHMQTTASHQRTSSLITVLSIFCDGDDPRDSQRSGEYRRRFPGSFVQSPDAGKCRLGRHVNTVQYVFHTYGAVFAYHAVDHQDSLIWVSATIFTFHLVFAFTGTVRELHK